MRETTTPLRIAMRCDASSVVGAGHVMRCHALGQQLAGRGHKVDFVGEFRELNWVRNVLSAYGVVSEKQVRWNSYEVVVIDSYSTSVQEVDLIRGYGCLTVLIADEATPRLPADLYVQPGISPSWQPPPDFSSSPQLRGLGALLLRREIREEFGRQRVGNGGGGLIVGLLLGASGSPAVGRQVLEAASSTGIPSTVCLIRTVKSFGPWVDRNIKVRWLDPGPGGIEVLVQSDVVISAAGVTAWEALHCGRPVALIATANNQEQNYSYMTESGVATGIGRLYLGEEIDLTSLKTFMSSGGNECPKSNVPTPGMDGLGVVRVVDEIERLRFGAESENVSGPGEGSFH